jgi:hypothetical protein
MAFNLTKLEQMTHQTLINELREAQDSFTAAQDSENPLKETVVIRLAELLVKINEAESFRDAVASRLRDEFDSKSEKWQESDRGDEASYLVDAWENASFEEPELEDPMNVELEENYAEMLEDLPTEM